MACGQVPGGVNGAAIPYGVSYRNGAGEPAGTARAPQGASGPRRLAFVFLGCFQPLISRTMCTGNRNFGYVRA